MLVLWQKLWEKGSVAQCDIFNKSPCRLCIE